MGTTPSGEASPEPPCVSSRPEPARRLGRPLPPRRGVCLQLPGGHAPCTCGPSSPAREERKVAVSCSALFSRDHSTEPSLLLHPLADVLSPSAPCPHSPNRLVLLGAGWVSVEWTLRVSSGRSQHLPSRPLLETRFGPSGLSAAASASLPPCVPAGPRSSAGLPASATFPVLDNASHLCSPGTPRAPMIWKKTA